MSSAFNVWSDLLFAIKREAYIFKETRWFCRFPKHQKLDKWTMAGEKRQTCWPKLHTETEYESQLKAIRWNRNIKKSWWQEKKEISDRYMAYLSTQETSAVELNSSSRDGKKEDRKEEVTEVSMKLCLVFLFATTLFSGLYQWRKSIRTNFLV